MNDFSKRKRTFGGVLSRPYLQKEAARQFHSLKEEEVIELLEQAEDDDERLLLNDLDEISVKPPKPLMSMPSAKPPARSESVSDLQSKPQVKRPYSSTSDRIRCGQIHALAKHKGISKSMSSLSLEAQKQEDQSSANCFCGDANELTRESLHALNNMKIKFPGKSNEEASRLLDSIMENWKYHKPKVASYWLVKLDSVKRKKVIDIVKGNVRAIIQRIWRVPDVDSLRLCRMFNKIMNRLLANHGQGLWNCFNTNGDSWESVINKGTESVTTLEMNCCRRVVQLCRECLLVVYEFASQAEASQTSFQQNSASFNPTESFHSKPMHHISSRFSAGQQFSGQRYSRTVQKIDHR